ncbi:MAG: phage tail protein [Oscillospiraceae bacterium]|jgi:phage tail sheath protein FI|nr:phage tail protein [Oscillospiraceae bacterium]
MPNHGVFVSEQATSLGTPVTAASGIPFVVGVAPIQSAESPAAPGTPVLCNGFDEALEKLGYSDDWANYTLCEFMHSHFSLYGMGPIIFCNLLAPATMKSSVAAANVSVTSHQAKLPITAINDATLVVKASGGAGSAYVKGTDYSTYYSGEFLVVELVSGSAHYAEASLNIAYTQVTPASVNAAAVAAGLESIEKCLSIFGVVPDLICAPGFSDAPAVAAVMAVKAAGINGMFRAKALIDISSAASGGATSYTAAMVLKGTNNFIDENEIVCWPMLKLGERTYHMSTQLAGLITKVDAGNEGCPYESPSNKNFQCDSLVLASGETLSQTKAQADALNAAGIVTALNFVNGWACWGNYTGCYPANNDVKDYLIPVARMFDWVGNTCIRTFWNKLDRPMNRRLVDTIVDATNIWLNGLVGGGYLLGARVEFREDENPLSDLMAGIIRLHIYMTPPSPAQEVDFVIEYDASYVAAALQG